MGSEKEGAVRHSKEPPRNAFSTTRHPAISPQKPVKHEKKQLKHKKFRGPIPCGVKRWEHYIFGKFPEIPPISTYKILRNP
jgi:hypothetical protein